MGKTITLNKERGVTVTPFLAEGENRPALLICPGGGYDTCELREGEPVAKAFNRLGFSCFVLCYSVGKHKEWPNPLQDFEQAMIHIKEHSAEYRIDSEHIAAAGFSAGGHLVSYVASTAENRPFAAIICYGATKASTINYTAPDAPDAIEAVSTDTCPCFIAASRNDWIVPVDNTTDFVKALEKNYVDYELHIYGYSMHGFSIGAEVGADSPIFCNRVGDWVREAALWLEDLISGRYISIKESAQYSDRYREVLSTSNSCGRIFNNPEAKKAIKTGFPAQYIIYKAAKKNVGSFVDDTALRDILRFLKVSDKTLGKMDAALSGYKNIKEE